MLYPDGNETYYVGGKTDIKINYTISLDNSKDYTEKNSIGAKTLAPMDTIIAINVNMI